ncbi:phosphate ABC transporter substrate-binding protein [Ruminiclostridium cellobioparum]|jgi:phosphate transport system substrate-binding protein|uniref:phosphate ABC transporter substrate-binding protein n=1 Tax=Ruminiclostridium cellobioparum TaxID=29355 RepID=UPI00048725D8|nr:phosphate ABC transporter substrate-binding protein [Ruminiclostridium cellobioparum]
MKKLMKSVILSLALTMSLSTALVGCGSNNETAADSSASGSTQVESSASSSTEAAPSSTAGVSGSATAVGSSALQPLAEKAAQIFMETNKEANIQVQGGGSGTGLKQVSEGGADIGNSDVYAEEKLPEDQAKALVDHKVCVVGFATVVNPKVKVDNLTKQQLIDIFTGKITNWKDAGGDDMKIVIVNRPSSSGTRATFKKYALDGAEEAEGMALTEDQSGTVKKAIADTDGAISYLALSYVDSTVKALKYEGIEPKVENITSGSYPIWAYEHMYTKGEPTGVVKAFLDFMTSDEFKPTITELGYIPNSEMKVSRDN